MGMYTDLQVSGIIKDEIVDEIKRLMECRLNGKSFWESSYIEVLRKFGENDDRADFIPMGGGIYHDELEEMTEGPKLSLVQKDDKYTWEFVCTLKNYNHTIETWMDEIAPLIFESATMYSWYEETNHPTKFVLTKCGLVDMGWDESMGYYEPEIGPYGLPL